MGNGVADNEFDGNALVPFAHGMGLISDDLYEVRGAVPYFNISYSSSSFFFLHNIIFSFQCPLMEGASTLLGLKICCSESI